MTEQLITPVPAAPQHHDHDSAASWEYTTDASAITELRRIKERAANRLERPTISRDSRIAEGVYEGAYGGEAIVVNYQNDPTLIDETVDAVLWSARDNQTGGIRKSEVLNGVFDEVSRRMRYDADAVDAIFKDDLKGRHGQKISLSSYIQKQVGVCRHQALYAGVVLEQLKDRGVISGMASVDRNMVRRGADGKYDGHAWVRYTNSAGNIFIIDIAHRKIGPLEDLMREHAQNPDTVWDYARPEDYGRQLGLAALQTTGEQPFDRSTYTNEDGIIDHVPWLTD